MDSESAGTPVLLTGIVRAGCCTVFLHPASNATQPHTSDHSGDFESSFIASPRPDIAQQQKPEV
jgi:hypothetical protein